MINKLNTVITLVNATITAIEVLKEIPKTREELTSKKTAAVLANFLC